MSASRELAQAVDRAVLTAAPEVAAVSGRSQQVMAGGLAYLYWLRAAYGPGAPMADVIERERTRLEAGS